MNGKLFSFLAALFLAPIVLHGQSNPQSGSASTVKELMNALEERHEAAEEAMATAFKLMNQYHAAVMGSDKVALFSAPGQALGPPQIAYRDSILRDLEVPKFEFSLVAADCDSPPKPITTYPYVTGSSSSEQQATQVRANAIAAAQAAYDAEEARTYQAPPPPFPTGSVVAYDPIAYNQALLQGWIDARKAWVEGIKTPWSFSFDRSDYTKNPGQNPDCDSRNTAYLAKDKADWDSEKERALARLQQDINRASGQLKGCANTAEVNAESTKNQTKLAEWDSTSASWLEDQRDTAAAAFLAQAEGYATKVQGVLNDGATKAAKEKYEYLQRLSGGDGFFPCGIEFKKAKIKWTNENPQGFDQELVALNEISKHLDRISGAFVHLGKVSSTNTANLASFDQSWRVDPIGLINPDNYRTKANEIQQRLRQMDTLRWPLLQRGFSASMSVVSNSLGTGQQNWNLGETSGGGYAYWEQSYTPGEFSRQFGVPIVGSTSGWYKDLAFTLFKDENPGSYSSFSGGAGSDVATIKGGLTGTLLAVDKVAYQGIWNLSNTTPVLDNLIHIRAVEEMPVTVGDNEVRFSHIVKSNGVAYESNSSLRPSEDKESHANHVLNNINHRITRSYRTGPELLGLPASIPVTVNVSAPDQEYPNNFALEMVAATKSHLQIATSIGDYKSMGSLKGTTTLLFKPDFSHIPDAPLDLAPMEIPELAFVASEGALDLVIPLPVGTPSPEGVPWALIKLSDEGNLAYASTVWQDDVFSHCFWGGMKIQGDRSDLTIESGSRPTLSEVRADFGGGSGAIQLKNYSLGSLDSVTLPVSKVTGSRGSVQFEWKGQYHFLVKYFSANSTTPFRTFEVSAGGVPDYALIAEHETKYPQGFEVISINRDGKLWQRATIIEEKSRVVETKDEFAKVESFSAADATEAEFIKYFIDGMYDPVTGTRPISIITDHRGGDEIEDRYITDSAVPSSHLLPVLLHTGRENWDVSLTKFYEGMIWELSPYLPVAGPDVGASDPILYTSEFLSASSGSDWKHLPFWRYPKTRTLQGSGWDRNGEVYTYAHDGSVVSSTGSIGGMPSTGTINRGENLLNASTKVGESTLSTTPTTFPSGLTKEVQTVDGIVSSVEYYASNSDSGLRWMPKSVTGPTGETTYTYTKETGGNIKTVQTFTPSASGSSSEITTTVTSKFGALVSQKVEQGDATVSNVVGTGHASNPRQLPTQLSVTSGGVSRVLKTEFNPDGTLKKLDDGNGTIDDFEWDMLNRIKTGTKFDGQAVVPDYGGFKNSLTIGGDKATNTSDAYGKLQKFSDESPGGFSRERISGNKFKTTIPSQGDRGFEHDYLDDGTPSDTGKGLGAPSSEVAYSVATVNGTPCISVATTVGPDGSDAPLYTRYFDGQGRLRRVTEPHPNGTGNVNTDYAYNMAARSVTITPPAPSKQIVIQYSTGWQDATITQGGAQYKISNSAVEGVISTLVTNQGREVFKREHSLATGDTVTKTNRRRAVSTSISANGNTLSVTGPYGTRNATFDRHGLATMNGSTKGQSFNVAVTRDNAGRPSSVAVDPPGPRSTITTAFDTTGRVTGVSGTGVNLSVNYNYDGGGVAVSGSDTVAGESFAASEDDEGNPKSLSATGQDSLTFTGKALDGNVSVEGAGFSNSFSYQFSRAGFVKGKSLSDQSGTSLTWNADGSLDKLTRYDGQANGGGSYSFTMTRDENTGFPTGYQGSRSSMVVVPNTDGTLASAEYRMKDADNQDQLHSVVYSDYFDNEPGVETYGGLLGGYSVKRVYNELTGDVSRVELSNNGTLVHAVDYTPDARGQVGTVVASVGKSFSASYGYPSDTVETLTAGAVVATRTSISNGSGNLASSVTTAGGASYSATYSYNTWHRRSGLTLTLPNEGQMVWNYSFQNAAKATGQLQSATLTQSGNVTNYTYNPNAAGDRAGSYPNNVNQYSMIQATGSRTISIQGAVQPGATVNIAMTGGGTISVPVESDGSFAATVPAPITGSSPGTREFEIIATLPGAGDQGANAVAAERRTVVLTPTTQNLTYRAHGALATDWRWTYHWNSEGRLEGLTTRSAAISAGLPNIRMKFAYDQTGRRIRKQVDYRSASGLAIERSVVSKFIYDGWLLLAEEIDDSAASGTIHRYYTWGKDISGSLGGFGGAGGLLAIHQDGISYVPIYDGNGNIIALTLASNGNRVATWSRGPFGEPFSSSGNTGICPFGFASHYTDDESGLVYFGHRYYSPVSGRWISREPLGETESFNLYAYCHNDPVNKVDVLGLEETAFKFGGFGQSNGTFLDSFQNTWIAPIVGDLHFSGAVEGAICDYLTSTARSSDSNVVAGLAYTGGFAFGVHGQLMGIGSNLLDNKSAGADRLYALTETLSDDGEFGAFDTVQVAATGFTEMVTPLIEFEQMSEGASLVDGHQFTAEEEVWNGYSAGMKILSLTVPVVETVQPELQAAIMARRLANGRQVATVAEAEIAAVDGTVAGETTGTALIQYDPVFALRYLDPVEIQFTVSRRATANMTPVQRQAFISHLAEQENALNSLSLNRTSDLELNLLNYSNIADAGIVDAARATAAGRMGLAGTGLDAAHALDSVAGGYIHNIPFARNPVQRTIGSLWRTRVAQIKPGRRHRLVPKFTE